jgi:hypothetical protein
MRRRILFIFTLPMMLAGVIMAAAPAAIADSPHFIRAAGTVNSDGSLTVNFKEAGLGTNQNIDYLLSGNGTAIYVCVNKGGANPSASNKTAVAGPVSATGTFSSGKNGQVTASLTVQPPFQDIGCPPGQTQQLASVTYTGMTLQDLTNGVSISLGDFSSGCLLPNVRGAC